MNLSAAAFIAGEVAFLAAVQVFGGPAWTVVAMAALITLSFAGPGLASLALAAPSLGWLAASLATGNRELFFPYAMTLAAVGVCRGGDRGTIWSLMAGAGVAAAFFAVRIGQQATARVLAVEVAVAVAILAGAVLGRTRAPRQPAVGGISGVALADAVIVVAASLAAYAGLAL